MTPEVPGMQEFEHDWLETQAHETILMAQSVAGTAVLTVKYRLPKYVQYVALPVPRLRGRSSALSVAVGWSDIYYS